MQEDTPEQVAAWRQEVALASRAGFRLCRKQAKNRNTDPEEYIEQLTQMVKNTSDPTLQQRYINFLADAIAYWQKSLEYQPSKATYSEC